MSNKQSITLGNPEPWEAHTTARGYTVDNIFAKGSGILIATVNNSENTILLTAARNACVAVNPNRPELVAQNIQKAFEALKELCESADAFAEYVNSSIMDEHIKQARAVLAAIESK